MWLTIKLLERKLEKATSYKSPGDLRKTSFKKTSKSI